MILYKNLVIQVFLSLRYQEEGSNDNQSYNLHKIANCSIYLQELALCLVCQYGYFYQPEKNICTACPENCSLCYENGDKWEQILICDNQGYYIQFNKTQICQSNCGKCESALECEFCSIGYFFDEVKQCTQCQQNCNICENQEYCLTCSTGFIRNKLNICVQCSELIPNCQDCIYSNSTTEIQEHQQLDSQFALICTSCSQNSILHPNLGKCELCENCSCAYQDISNNIVIYPLDFINNIETQKVCQFCPQGQQLIDGICQLCKSECQNGCYDDICQNCQEGYQLIFESCLSCSQLTGIQNCRKCKQATQIIQQWMCQDCFPGFGLNHIGLCLKCQNPFCSSDQNLRIINKFQADYDQSYNSIFLNETIILCSQKEQYEPLQLMNDELKNLNISWNDYIWIEIPYSHNSQSYCQLCPIGCKQCQFNPYSFYGICMQNQCQDGYIQIKRICLVEKSGQILHNQLLIDVKINCSQESLGSINEKINSDPIFQILNCIPISIYSLNITIDQGFDCLVEDMVNFQFEKNLFYQPILNEFQLQSSDPTQQINIICKQFINCLSLNGYNFIKINNIHLIYSETLTFINQSYNYFLEIISNEQQFYALRINNIQSSINASIINTTLQIEYGLALLNLLKISKKCQINISQITFHGPSMKIKSFLQIQSDQDNVTDNITLNLNEINFSNIKFENQLINLKGFSYTLNFSEINFLNDCIFINFNFLGEQTQINQVNITNLNMNLKSITNSVFLKFNKRYKESDISNPKFNIQNVLLTCDNFIDSILILNLNDHLQIDVQNLTIKDSYIQSIQLRPLFKSTQLSMKNIYFHGKLTIQNMFLVSANSFSKYPIKIFLDSITFYNVIAFTDFLIFQFREEHSFIYQSIDLIFQNITVQITQIDFSSFIFQNIFAKEVKLFDIKGNSNIINILIQNVQVYESPLILIGDFIGLKSFIIEGYLNYQQLVTNEEINAQKCQVQQSQQIKSNYLLLQYVENLKLVDIKLQNINSQISIFNIFNSQQIQIDTLQINCFYIEPYQEDQNPALIRITGTASQNIQLKRLLIQQNQFVIHQTILFQFNYIAKVLLIQSPIVQVSIQQSKFINNFLTILTEEQDNSLPILSIQTLVIVSKSLYMKNVSVIGSMNNFTETLQNLFNLKEINTAQEFFKLGNLDSEILLMDYQISIILEQCDIRSIVGVHSAGLNFVGSSQLETFQIKQCNFTDLYCLGQGCFINVQSRMSQNISIQITDSRFTNILSFTSPIINFDQKFQSINLTFNNVIFTNILSLDQVSLIDINQNWFHNLNDQKLIIPTQTQQTQKYDYTISLKYCIFQNDQTFNWILYNDVSIDNQKKYPILLRGYFVALFIDNCEFYKLFHYYGLLQLSNSYLSIQNTQFHLSLWGDTFINILNSFVVMQQIDIRNINICTTQVICEQITGVIKNMTNRLNLLYKKHDSNDLKFQKARLIQESNSLNNEQIINLRNQFNNYDSFNEKNAENILIPQDIQQEKIQNNQNYYYIHQIEQIKKELLETNQSQSTHQNIIIVEDTHMLFYKHIGSYALFENVLIDQIDSSFSPNSIFTFTYNTQLELRNINFVNSISKKSLILINQLYNNSKQEGIISGCQFNNNVAQSSIQLNSVSLTIENTLFNNSNATSKSQIYYQSDEVVQKSTYQLKIIGTQFLNNIGNIKSGAIYIEEKSLKYVDISIINCIFNNNVGFYAGAIYSLSVYPIIENCSFIQNKALQTLHNDILLPPIKLMVSFDNEIIKEYGRLQEEILSTFENSLPRPLYIKLLQQNDEEILLNETFSQEKYINVIYNELNGENKNLQESFIIQNISIISKPGSIVLLKISSPLIIDSDYNFSLELKVRDCIVGEIYLDESGICSKCLPSTYSFDKIKCYECPYSAICPGGSQLFIRPTFWRDSNDSAVIVQCVNALTNCIGDSKNTTMNNIGNQQFFDSNKYCLTGFIGPLCETCDIQAIYWPYSYTQYQKNNCVRCSELKYNVLISAFVILFTLGTISFSVNSLINDIEKDLQIYYLKKMGFYYGNMRGLARQKSCLYKIVLYHIQILQTIFTFKQRPPIVLDIVLSSVANQMNYFSYSLNCFLEGTVNLQLIPFVYWKNIFVIIIPFGLFFGYIICFRIAVLFKWVRPRIYHIYTSFFFILLLFQPQIVRVNIETMACREIAGEYYIQGDVTQKCNSPTHIFYILTLILPGLFIFILLIPGLIWLKLYNNKDKLDNYQMKFFYGFIFLEFKKNAYYWENVKSLQRVSIFFVLSFFQQETQTKGIFILAAIQIYLVACLNVQPYINSNFTKIDILSQLCNLITIMITLLIMDSDSSELLIIYIVIIITMNLYWITVVVRDVAFNQLRLEMKKILRSIQNQIHYWRVNGQRRMLTNSRRISNLIEYVSFFLGLHRQEKTHKIWGKIRLALQNKINQIKNEQNQMKTFEQYLMEQFNETEGLSNNFQQILIGDTELNQKLNQTQNFATNQFDLNQIYLIRDEIELVSNQNHERKNESQNLQEQNKSLDLKKSQVSILGQNSKIQQGLNQSLNMKKSAFSIFRQSSIKVSQNIQR